MMSHLKCIQQTAQDCAPRLAESTAWRQLECSSGQDGKSRLHTAREHPHMHSSTFLVASSCLSPYRQAPQQTSLQVAARSQSGMRCRNALQADAARPAAAKSSPLSPHSMAYASHSGSEQQGILDPLPFQEVHVGQFREVSCSRVAHATCSWHSLVLSPNFAIADAMNTGLHIDAGTKRTVCLQLCCMQGSAPLQPESTAFDLVAIIV